VLNQLRKPRVVDVAAKVAGFDPPVPKAGGQQNYGNRHDLQPISPKKNGRGFKARGLEK
jgi:hypothetical protein